MGSFRINATAKLKKWLRMIKVNIDNIKINQKKYNKN